MKSKLAQVMGTILVVMTFVFSAQAQVTTGTVRGVVTDPQGAVVPNAKITLTRKSTNETKTATSSGSGNFEFTSLSSGEDYSILIEAPNFKTLTLTDVRVNLNQVTDLPTQLEVGTVGETVTVTAGGTELVDTTTTTLSKSFSEDRLLNWPRPTSAGPLAAASIISPSSRLTCRVRAVWA